VKIALTGAGGSIGRALTARAHGHELLPFPRRPELDLAAGPGPAAEWLRTRRPDAIVHLAGRRGGAAAVDAFRDNVTATYNLLAAVAAAGPRTRIVLASSAAVYGNAAGRAPLSVAAERRPVNAYGVSKALQEDVCALARASNGADITIGRIFNLAGAPGDTWSVVPSLIARIGAAADGSEITISHATCTRDFVSIDDVCDALLRAAVQPAVPAVFNVATGTATTIGSLAQRIADVLDRRVHLVLEDDTDTATIQDSVGDATELHALGCAPEPLSDRDIAALAAAASAV
jgi:nucleoside-diphosphate-sugar epimerase